MPDLPTVPPQSVPPLDTRGGDPTLPPLFSLSWWLYFNSISSSLKTVVENLIVLDALRSRTATVSLSEQTSAIAATAIPIRGVVAPVGIYQVSLYATCTSAGSGGAALTVNIIFNDGTALRTYPWGCSLTTTSGISSSIVGVQTVKVDGIVDLQYSTAVVTTGGPKYSLDIVVEKIV